MTDFLTILAWASPFKGEIVYFDPLQLCRLTQYCQPSIFEPFSVFAAPYNIMYSRDKPWNIIMQPVGLHTGLCTNRNPVWTVMIIWSRINYTQNNAN